MVDRSRELKASPYLDPGLGQGGSGIFGEFQLPPPLLGIYRNLASSINTNPGIMLVNEISGLKTCIVLVRFIRRSHNGRHPTRSSRIRPVSRSHGGSDLVDLWVFNNPLVVWCDLYDVWSDSINTNPEKLSFEDISMLRTCLWCHRESIDSHNEPQSSWKSRIRPTESEI